ncbi:MAG: biotin/lipoyl-binding protein, partial [Bacteroidota bacterium]
MDKPRTLPPRSKTIYLISFIVLTAIGLGYWYGHTPGLRVASNGLTVAAVTTDQFYEYINLNAQVTPGEVYYLDSRVAGNVEEIFVEAGQQVLTGDTLLFISNADLELEVMQREGELIEQLNAQRQTRLLLNQNDFARREALLETDYRLALRRKQFSRDTALLADSLLAARDFEPTANDLAYLNRRQQLLRAAYRQDSLARALQLAQIAATEDRLLKNLQRVRAILDRRYVLAPAAGRLANFEVRTGQAITMGERLGELYQLRAPIFLAEADEFYLERIFPGQTGLLLGGYDSLALTVTKIYPTVESGRFRVELALAEQSATVPKGSWTKG